MRALGSNTGGLGGPTRPTGPFRTQRGLPPPLGRHGQLVLCVATVVTSSPLALCRVRACSSANGESRLVERRAIQDVAVSVTHLAATERSECVVAEAEHFGTPNVSLRCVCVRARAREPQSPQRECQSVPVEQSTRQTQPRVSKAPATRVARDRAGSQSRLFRAKPASRLPRLQVVPANEGMT